MAKTVQLKRGTTAQTNAYVGALGEVTIDTNKDLPVVHDGSQAGGFAVAARANVDGSVSEINRTGSELRTTSSAGLDTSARKRASNAGTAADAALQVVSAGNGLFAPATNSIGEATNGIERRRVGNDGSMSSVIPGGSTLYPDFAIRAWVNFNGTTGAIRASGNVSSVTRNSTGDYTVNFTTSMPDVNYAPQIANSSDGSARAAANLFGQNSLAAGVVAPLVSSFRFALFTVGAANADSTYVSVNVSR